MRAYYIINDDGYFIEMVLLIKQPNMDYHNYIGLAPPHNLHRPRWNGTEWEEGYIIT